MIPKSEQLEYTLQNEDELATPYFLLNEKELQNNIRNLKAALCNYWGNYIIGYSFKTNSLPWLVNYLKNNGCYAEVVSDDEYELGKITGYAKHTFIYNGPNKTKKTFLEAIKNGCIVNIDSQRELEWLKELDTVSNYEVGIRANFALESYCPNESVAGKSGSRFGFCYENGELKKVINFIRRLENIKITGIHLHCSTKTRSLNVYRAIAMIACKIKKTFSLELKYIDIGGGFFGGLMDKPQFNDYIRVIASELITEFKQATTTLIVEPGTSLVSSPFSFVTSVIDVKDTALNRFVVTDGSRIYVDPLMSKTKYFFKIIHVDKTNITKKQTICGFTCMENDRLFSLENYPRCSVGDKIIYEKVGAYTMCLTPLFIKYFPAVYVNMNGIFCVREKWTIKEYTQNARGIQS